MKKYPLVARFFAKNLPSSYTENDVKNCYGEAGVLIYRKLEAGSEDRLLGTIEVFLGKPPKGFRAKNLFKENLRDNLAEMVLTEHVRHVLTWDVEHETMRSDANRPPDLHLTSFKTLLDVRVIGKSTSFKDQEKYLDELTKALVVEGSRILKDSRWELLFKGKGQKWDLKITGNLDQKSVASTVANLKGKLTEVASMMITGRTSILLLSTEDPLRITLQFKRFLEEPIFEVFLSSYGSVQFASGRAVRDFSAAHLHERQRKIVIASSLEGIEELAVDTSPYFLPEIKSVTRDAPVDRIRSAIEDKITQVAKAGYASAIILVSIEGEAELPLGWTDHIHEIFDGDYYVAVNRATTEAFLEAHKPSSLSSFRSDHESLSAVMAVNLSRDYQILSLEIFKNPSAKIELDCAFDVLVCPATAK